MTHKSPKTHTWKGQAARVTDMTSDETFVTTQKFSLVTKSLDNGFDHGLLSRVDFYPSGSLIVI